MLVNLKAILGPADKHGYAVGGFNITTAESALAIIQAAEEERSPAILQISEKTIEYFGLHAVFGLAKSLADRSLMPIAIHFDHGRDFDLVAKSIEVGFSSVMLDVSKLAKDKRIPFVKAFIAKAHKRGVTVEVEEDQIGGREDYVKGEGGHFTDPLRAKSFVAATNCDAFAVSIGEVHGKPLPDEKLDLELLARIDAAVGVPLVLHGASSTPEPIIKEAIVKGIRKINIDTDLRLAFSTAVRATLKADADVYDPRDVLKPSKEAIKQVVVKKMRLFGSSGRVKS